MLSIKNKLKYFSCVQNRINCKYSSNIDFCSLSVSIIQMLFLNFCTNFNNTKDCQLTSLFYSLILLAVFILTSFVHSYVLFDIKNAHVLFLNVIFLSKGNQRWCHEHWKEMGRGDSAFLRNSKNSWFGEHGLGAVSGVHSSVSISVN